ncbi:SMI1/KNR4 family protein [Streptomyces sp. WMMC500]|uniref:SMI1/KNR4 family protein n=1 Tax=Streptomyces sp. WMMC500 TaxID=3015154 RepID=UPI00248CF113|nr:SMI1/KNR4 family protein [Streptomyces sp. WMMC500]WBB63889.1 SMI1/KNR4 family protein [Streptomyces sp. WMMC500]
MEWLTVNSIGHSWSRIESWLRDRDEMRELAPPATERDIALVEGRLGVRLPPEVSESLRYHNGSGAFTLPPHFGMLSTLEIVKAWEVKVSVWAGSDYHPFSAHYVQFATDGCGGELYLDARNWKDRHIREHDKEGADLRSAHPMWSSITSLLHHTAQALESGEELDGYYRPGGDGDFLLWRFTDADAVEDVPKRIGKFGIPISE